MADLLLVDDDHEVRRTLAAALGRRGFRVDTAADLAAVRTKPIERYDLILLDVFLPDGNGVDFLRDLVARPSLPPVVMISGQAEIETAVAAIRMGAVDFLEKPLSLDRLLVTIENVLKTRRLAEENQHLSQIVYGRLLGQSPAMRRIRKEIETTAPRSQRFLILGENGTGKELVARMIHEKSRFASGRFVPVNCAALPAELVESELFGHIKGSFTGAAADKTGRFAEADRGSIFLDEIADMKPDAQAKILRVLESGELRPVGSNETIAIDLTVIAATNHPIDALVADGRFRQDLYYRLNVVTIALPPLRERRDDIPSLYEHFLTTFAARIGRPPLTIAPDAMDLLIAYRYPGNVRELKNIAERISIYIDKPEASKADIKALLPYTGDDAAVPLKEAVDSFEANYIRRVIADCGGNMTEAARRLGLERSHLYKKLRQFDNGGPA
jgi:two-component system nitrogen regulation response regulator NtrX